MFKGDNVKNVSQDTGTWILARDASFVHVTLSDLSTPPAISALVFALANPESQVALATNVLQDILASLTLDAAPVSVTELVVLPHNATRSASALVKKMWLVNDATDARKTCLASQVGRRTVENARRVMASFK
jgi:hypothetical protein